MSTTDRQAVFLGATEIFLRDPKVLSRDTAAGMALELWEGTKREDRPTGEAESSRRAHAALDRIATTVSIAETLNPYDEIPEAVEDMKARLATALRSDGSPGELTKAAYALAKRARAGGAPGQDYLRIAMEALAMATGLQAHHSDALKRLLSER